MHHPWNDTSTGRHFTRRVYVITFCIVPKHSIFLLPSAHKRNTLIEAIYTILGTVFNQYDILLRCLWWKYMIKFTTRVTSSDFTESRPSLRRTLPGSSHRYFLAFLLQRRPHARKPELPQMIPQSPSFYNRRHAALEIYLLILQKLSLASFVALFSFASSSKLKYAAALKCKQLLTTHF